MQTRRHFIARMFLALAAGGTCPSAVARPREDAPLHILHTNDTHSRLNPFSANDSAYPGLGGAARRARMIKEFRAEHPNVLLLDSGDYFQGTPFFNMFEGEPEIKVMTQLGYDAATLGNHDFDVKVSGLKRALRFGRFPVVVSNYDVAHSEIRDRVKPWIILRRGGWKVGLFGLGVDFAQLVPDELHEGVTYLDPIPVAREMVQTLRNKRCDVVICLSHLGYRPPSAPISDQVLARNVHGIDLILGGHSHTFLDKPEIMASSNGWKTAVGQVGCFGVRLGIISLRKSPGAELAISGGSRSVSAAS